MVVLAIAARRALSREIRARVCLESGVATRALEAEGSARVTGGYTLAGGDVIAAYETECGLLAVRFQDDDL
jgi:hypothetical protein